MPKYKLTPNPEHLDDPLWENSTTQSPLIVEAENEEEARQIAADMTQGKPFSNGNQ